MCGKREKREKGIDRDVANVAKVFWKGGGYGANFLRDLLIS